MKTNNNTNQNHEMPSGRVFEVTITETLKRKVLVHESELKAPTVDDAVQTVSDWWHNSQIILESEDFVDVGFEAREVTEGGGQDA